MNLSMALHWLYQAREKLAHVTERTRRMFEIALAKVRMLILMQKVSAA